MLLDMKSKTMLADGIKRELHDKKMNYAIIITGRPQRRKSTTGLRICLDVDEGFDLATDAAVIKSKDMLKALDTSATTRRGKAKFLDELGVGMNHREWHSFLNQAMSFIMQTDAHEGKLVVVTAPYQDYVDSDARKLFNMLIEMVGKDDRRGFAIAKVQEMEYNEKMKKIYYKYPRGRRADGQIVALTRFYIKYPPKDKLEQYFSISKPAKEELKRGLVSQANRIELKEESKVFDPQEYARKLLDSHPEAFENGKTGAAKIQNAFPGLSVRRASQVYAAVRTLAKVQGGNKPASD